MRKSTRNDEFIYSVNKQEKYDYEYLYFITNILPQVFNLSVKQLKQKYPETYPEPIVAKLKLIYVKQVAYPINKEPDRMIHQKILRVEGFERVIDPITEKSVLSDCYIPNTLGYVHVYAEWKSSPTL